jgi:hypothetical protein
MLENRTLAFSGLVSFLLSALMASGCETTSSGTKPTSSRTAASAINEKIDDGTINVKGDTDNAPLP